MTERAVCVNLYNSVAEATRPADRRVLQEHDLASDLDSDVDTDNPVLFKIRNFKPECALHGFALAKMAH